MNCFCNVLVYENDFYLFDCARCCCIYKEITYRTYMWALKVDYSLHFHCSAAIARTVGHLSKSAEVMKIVNNLMKAPEVAVTMQEFSKEMTKVCYIISIKRLYSHYLSVYMPHIVSFRVVKHCLNYYIATLN